MDNLYSLDYEQFLLSSILQDNNVILNLSFLQSRDFTATNGIIYELCKNAIENKGSASPLTISEKAKSLSLKLDGVEVIDYLTALAGRTVNSKEILEIAKEIKKLSLIRHVIKKADELKETVSKATTKPASEIFEAVDKTLSKSLETFETSSNEAINVYDGLADLAEIRGNTPRTIVGYTMPFKSFNDYYGGIRNGEMYVVASRASNGKSTYLQFVMDKIINECNPDLDIKGLYMDTEMQKDDFSIRLLAQRLKVPAFLIDSGNWRKDIIWYPVMREGLKELSKNKKNNLYFYQVSSMSVRDLCSFIKKWYYNKVGRGNPGIVSYDYLKVLMSDNTNGQSEWVALNNKMQQLKDTIDEINVPLLTAIQVNRSGITSNRQSSEVVDDESAISTSDRVGWLSAMLSILRRKTADEIVRDGINAGSHKQIILKARYQGFISKGHHDFVRLCIDKKIQYKMNYMNLNIDNFSIEDRGTLYDLAERNGWLKIKDSGNESGDVAI